ncbi:polymorphic toxin type 17 domain-containing protein [Klebsiella variicola]|uniref:polymorphic toxin type 17 domain-containing protein n=1 Tax=Klebsiella pneumoniae complex TaxID=3390273 RepID=UPI0015A73F80|nr:polymorphic toxin type 17 domain-containing protein [Klebsiella variicola]
MKKITFCPHHILNINIDLEPRVIEAYFISPLVDFIKSANNQGMKVCISQSLLEIFEEKHPWSLCEDAVWSKWIADWYGVLKPLLEQMDIVVHPNENRAGVVRCTGISNDINNIFCNFLDSIATHTFYDGSNEESVYTPTPWCSNFNDFISIKRVEDIKFAKYTWYRIYPDNLPCAGTFPFVPPENWRRNAAPVRAGAPNYGYIDDHRREWKWDRLHNDHWDVQHPGGGRNNYTNVTPDGDIL